MYTYLHFQTKKNSVDTNLNSFLTNLNHTLRYIYQRITFIKNNKEAPTE